MSTILECDSVSKVYGSGTLAEQVLSGITLTLRRAETCVLFGPSGSGKTTLLSILGCMLSPSSGTLKIDGAKISHRSKSGLGYLRRKYIGFVFQHAQLLPFLNVEDNLAIAGRNSGMTGRELKYRIADLFQKLGIEALRNKKPHHLSGGQRQRVAIARAMLHRPPIILADEPTAALDWQNGENVVQLLVEHAKQENAALVTVTHDTRLIGMFDRVMRIDAGRIQEQHP